MHQVARALGAGLRAASGLVLPARCAGCGRTGSPWCEPCRVATGHLVATGHPAVVGAGRGLLPGCPRCWSATVLDGPVRAVVSAHKDGGRRDARAVLLPLLAGSLGRAVREDPMLRRSRARGEPVLAVPVPAAASARRRRGGDPVADLARAAARAVDPGGLVLAPVLVHTRRVADQSRLGRAERTRNLAGALVVADRARPVVRGRACVLLDDVVTTGATLAEAARALREAGAGHVVAATAAATA